MVFKLYSFRTVADATFLLIALALALMSLVLISSTFHDHLRNYKYPALQTCCMRILLLAPIYALVSWFMMVLLPVASYLEVLRDIYEAYSIYCFWVLLVLWCGGQRRVIEILSKESGLDCLLCPLLKNHGCGLPVTRFREAKGHFRYLRVAAMNCMLCKPCMTLACALLAGSPAAAHMRKLRLLVLLSTAFAMHSIFQLYMCTLPYMRGLDASRKFVALKIAVGVIVFQQLIVNALLSADVIPEGKYGYTAEDKAQRIMCTITIIEMALFSLLLSYLFSRRSMTREGAEGAMGGGGLSPKPAGVPHSSSIVFSKVIGDTAGDAEPVEDYVSMLSVLAFWDVLFMSKVEERSMSCSAGVPLPVELEVVKNGFNIVKIGDGKQSSDTEAPTGSYALTTAVARPVEVTQASYYAAKQQTRDPAKHSS